MPFWEFDNYNIFKECLRYVDKCRDKYRGVEKALLKDTYESFGLNFVRNNFENCEKKTT